MLHQRDRLRGRGHLVEDRVGQVALDQAVDGAVEGGREQQGLVGLVEPAQHPLDLGHEAHVGHAVGLVEHQRLELGHRDLAAVAQVDQAARRGDDHVDALAELGHLALDVGAAVDGEACSPSFLASGASTSCTWTASSRVGSSTSASGGRAGAARGGLLRVPVRAALTRWSSGSPKARVLPDPVLALPHTSRPARASATVRAWIGKALTMPSSASALVSSVETPSDSKVRDVS